MKHCVVLAGTGRSGSNRLLDIADMSSATICRSEANAVVGGDFAKIQSRLFRKQMSTEDQNALLRAIGRAPYRRSERDRQTQTEKSFFQPKRLAQFGQSILYWAKLRSVLARTSLLDGSKEWTVPTAYVDKEKINSSVLFLKLNACPAWTLYLHETDPSIRIVHNIRNPIEYLNSWYNRFTLKAKPESFKENFWQARQMMNHFGVDDTERLTDFSHESLVEIELWRWRYINEQLYLGLKGTDRSMLVTYSEISANALVAAERIYEFSGLEFDAQARRSVENMKNTLFTKPHTEKIDTTLYDTVSKRVLQGSSLLDIPGLI